MELFITNTNVSLVATLCTSNHHLHVLLYLSITLEGIIKYIQLWNKIFSGGTKLLEKIVPGTKIFTKKFVPQSEPKLSGIKFHCQVNKPVLDQH